MTTEYYVIQVDRRLLPNSSDFWDNYYEEHPEEAIFFHSGGRGNGAEAGMYRKEQLNRILGKYPKGAAKALRVFIEGFN